MTTRTVDPTFVRDEALQSVKDHIEDVYCQLPIVGAHTTPETLTAARESYRRLGGALTRLEEAQGRVDACTREALRGMSTSPESVAISKDLKKRGWTFVGPTTVYAFMQAMGLVNDHAPGCVVRAQVERARGAFQPPVC